MALQFRATRCVRYRFRYSECRRCVDACPHDAISAHDAGVTIDATRCRDCALCSSACRTEALAASNLSRVDLLRAAGGRARYAIACAPSGLSADTVVPCLGALDAPTLAYLSHREVAVELRGSTHCGGCEHAPQGAEQLALNIEGVEILRREVGDADWAAPALSNAAPAEKQRSAYRPARRDFFRRVAHPRGAAPNAEAPKPAVSLRSIRAAEPCTTAGRELMQLLWPDARDEPRFALAPHPALPLARIALDARRCTSCEACARTCPTGAVQALESGVAWGLMFDIARCVGCQVCVEACQPRALRESDAFVSDALLATEPRTLHALPKKRCTRCDRFFISAEPIDVCEICRGDDADFDALFG